MKDNTQLIYMIVLLIIGITIKYIPPFKTIDKLQKLSPLLIIPFFLPMLVITPFNPKAPMLHVCGLILIIYSIWRTIKNFRTNNEDANPE